MPGSTAADCLRPVHDTAAKHRHSIDSDSSDTGTGTGSSTGVKDTALTADEVSTAEVAV